MKEIKIKIKMQTKAQRLANPVWLRQQIAELVARADDRIVAWEHNKAGGCRTSTPSDRYPGRQKPFPSDVLGLLGGDRP